MSSHPALQLEHISKAYKLYGSYFHMARDVTGINHLLFWKKKPSFPMKQALSDISLTIEKGQKIGLIGRNGAGKTTLLKILSGLVVPSTGKMIVNGTVECLMTLGGGFHDDLTGRQNVENALVYKGLRGAAIKNAMADVLEFAELGVFIDQPLQNYSLGMKARLQFAVATTMTPDILIIDEVLGAGDGYFATKSQERMKGLINKGCTLILVSHSKGQIMEFCETAIWLDQGRVRQEGAVGEVYAAYERELLQTKPQQEIEQERETLPLPPEFQNQDFQKTILQDIEKRFSGIAISHHGAILKTITVKVNGAQTNQTMTGDYVSIMLNLDISKAQKGDLCALLFYDHLGRCVTQLEPQGFDPRLEALFWNIEQLPLGHRHYFVAVIVIRDNQVIDLSTDHFLKVIETNDSDPPLLHYPAIWFYGEDKTPHKARISGLQ